MSTCTKGGTRILGEGDKTKKKKEKMEVKINFWGPFHKNTYNLERKKKSIFCNISKILWGRTYKAGVVS